MKKRCADDQCRRAGKRLDITEFWRNKSMRNGYDLYCRECRYRRNESYREHQRRRMNAVRPPRKPMMPAEKQDPFTKVYQQIKQGRRTREEIQHRTKLSYDAIGDALLELVFYSKVVRIVNRRFVVTKQEVEAA